MAIELDPISLDRKLRDAASVWSRWRRRLREGHGFDEEPLLFHREVTSRQRYQELGDLVGKDPLAAHLQRWMYRLTEQRINTRALLGMEALRRVESHVIEAPERVRGTLSHMLHRALEVPAQRAAWLDGFTRHAGELAAHTGLLWERRAEIARRMGVADLNAIETCNPDSAAFASRLLSQTDDMAQAFQTRSLQEFVKLSLGSGLEEGWPARLTVRTLAELFDKRLFDSLTLEAGPMPSPVAGSSFLRGVARLGAAWVSATAPRHQPFVVAHDAYGLRRRVMGALLAGVVCSPPFTRKVFGLSSERAREHARASARVLLLHWRAQAMRVLLRSAALEGRISFARAFEEHTERVSGRGLAGSLAGSLFVLHIDDTQRFAGGLLASQRSLELANAHDEDWFRNPRAIDQLRSEAELSPESTCQNADLEHGLKALCETLQGALR